MTGAAATGVAVAGLTAPGTASAARPVRRSAVTESTFFATASVEYAASLNTASDGDLWASAWADDDAVYAANGDGRGFSDEPFQDIVVNRITGDPESGIDGTRLAAADQVGNIWADPDLYNRKPTGMVCVEGSLYLVVQDLRKEPSDAAFNDVPNASISRSDDHGVTWQKTSAPMFTDHVFTTIFFADFGKNYANAEAALGPAGARYVYAYGLDGNWRDSYNDSVPDPPASTSPECRGTRSRIAAGGDSTPARVPACRPGTRTSKGNNRHSPTGGDSTRRYAPRTCTICRSSRRAASSTSRR